MIGGIENREVILHEAFPALFNIAQDIEAFVGDFMRGNNGTMFGISHSLGLLRTGNWRH